jgi:hypothetical protein
MLYKESRDYMCKVADNADGAKELIEAGSKYVCEFKNKRLFRTPSKNQPEARGRSSSMSVGSSSSLV